MTSAPPALKKFKLLAEDTHRQQLSTGTGAAVTDVQSLLDRLEAEMQTMHSDDGLVF